MKFDALNFSRDTLKEAVDFFLFVKAILQRIRQEYILPDTDACADLFKKYMEDFLDIAAFKKRSHGAAGALLSWLCAPDIAVCLYIQTTVCAAI